MQEGKERMYTAYSLHHTIAYAPAEDIQASANRGVFKSVDSRGKLTYITKSMCQDAVDAFGKSTSEVVKQLTRHAQSPTNSTYGDKPGDLWNGDTIPTTELSDTQKTSTTAKYLLFMVDVPTGKIFIDKLKTATAKEIPPIITARIKRHTSIHGDSPNMIIFDREGSLRTALNMIHATDSSIATRNTGGKIHCPKAEAKIGEMKRRQRGLINELPFTCPSHLKPYAFIYACAASNILHRGNGSLSPNVLYGDTNDITDVFVGSCPYGLLAFGQICILQGDSRDKRPAQHVMVVSLPNSNRDVLCYRHGEPEQSMIKPYSRLRLRPVYYTPADWNFPSKILHYEQFGPLPSKLHRKARPILTKLLESTPQSTPKTVQFNDEVQHEPQSEKSQNADKDHFNDPKPESQNGDNSDETHNDINNAEVLEQLAPSEDVEIIASPRYQFGARPKQT
jgi:hypothetical protein